MKGKLIKFCCLGLILSLVAVSFSGCKLFGHKKHSDAFVLPPYIEKPNVEEPKKEEETSRGESRRKFEDEVVANAAARQKWEEEEKAKHPDTVRDYKMWENRPYKGFIWQTHWKVHEECEWQLYPGEIVQEPVWPDYEWNDVEPGFQQHTVIQRADGYKCNCTRTYG